MIPLWGYAAGGLLVGVVAFGAGWQVREWRCEAAVAKTYKAGIERGKEQQAAVHAQSVTYEQERADAVVQTNTYERELRTIYRDRTVPVECAVPDTAVGVLERAVDSANARARGEPSAAVPTDPVAADAAGRPGA